MRGLTAVATCLPLAALAFLAGASHDTFSSPTGDSKLLTAGYAIMPADEPQRPEKGNKLAVVVPAYNGDLDRAVASLGRWPTDCSPLTVQNVDLVLYYAEGEEDSEAVGAAAEVIAATAGRCFADVRTVYAHLEQEVRDYCTSFHRSHKLRAWYEDIHRERPSTGRALSQHGWMFLSGRRHRV